MRGIFKVLAFSLFLTACQTGPQYVAYKSGTTFSNRQLDYDQCKILALNEIPTDIRTQYSPGYYKPGSLSCSTIGNYTSCNRIGAVDIPASASQYDANSNLRQRSVMRCMAAKGYQFLEKVPMCKSDAERKEALSTPQPQTPAKICNAGVPLDS